MQNSHIVCDDIDPDRFLSLPLLLLCQSVCAKYLCLSEASLTMANGTRVIVSPDASRMLTSFLASQQLSKVHARQKLFTHLS